MLKIVFELVKIRQALDEIQMLAENRAATTQERTRHQRQAMSKEYEEAFRDLIRSIRELQDQGRTDNEIIDL